MALAQWSSFFSDEIFKLFLVWNLLHSNNKFTWGLAGHYLIQTQLSHLHGYHIETKTNLAAIFLNNQNARYIFRDDSGFPVTLTNTLLYPVIQKATSHHFAETHVTCVTIAVLCLYILSEAEARWPLLCRNYFEHFVNHFPYMIITAFISNWHWGWNKIVIILYFD